jgi:hypothetical protein
MADRNAPASGHAESIGPDASGAVGRRQSSASVIGQVFPNEHASPLDTQAPRGIKGDCLRQRDALRLKDARRKRRKSVIIEHGDTSLENDRTCVVGVVREMDGAARDFYTGFDRGLMNAFTVEAPARKRGNQRRVNIDHSSDVILGNCQKRQVTPENDEVGFVVTNGCEDARAKILERAPLSRYDFDRQSRPFRLRDCANPLSAAYDLNDCRLKRADVYAIDQILQSRPTPGHAYGESDRRIENRRVSGRLRHVR